MRNISHVISFFLLTGLFSIALAIERDHLLVKGAVITDPLGHYRSENLSCVLNIEIDGMGGYRKLLLPLANGNQLAIDDVTALGTLSENELIISTSPVYGNPGIIKLNCLSGQIKALKRGKHKSKAYPNGSDYFQLSQISTDKISYYYFSNVDSADFETMKLPKNIKILKR